MMGVIFLAVGIAAGVLSGLFGIGGGSLIVPALITLVGMDVLHASATSLASMLLPVGILGVWQYHKAGLVKWKVAGILAGGLLMGSALGAEIGMALPLKWLEVGYSLFLLYIAQGYLGVSGWIRGKPAEEELDDTTPKDAGWPMWLLVGFLAGIVAGLFGKGGGVIVVPILMTFFAYSAKQATATSLAALQLPVGLPGVVMYARSGVLDLQFAGWVALGLLAGTFFGTRLAIGLKPALFKKLFGLFLMGVAVFLLLRV